MILGEAPGRREDETGRNFSGPAGRLLWNELLTVGIDRRDVFAANAVCCYPGRTPTDGEITACRGNLFNQVKLCRPKIILALGLTANWTLGREGPMGKIRGHWYEIGLVHPLSIGVFPTYHPAAVLRKPLLTKAWRENLKAFANEAEKHWEPCR